jgi:hypothetical protein
MPLRRALRLLLPIAVLSLSGCWLIPTSSTPPPPAHPGYGASGGQITPPLAVAPSVPGASTGVPLSVGMRPDRRLEERARINEVPQVAGRYELYADLKDGPYDPVATALMVCDLRLPGTPWYQSRPDMQAEVTIAGGRAMTLVGEDNRDATVMTAPVASMKSGDELKLVLVDRDWLGHHDYLDTATGTYYGVFPLLLVGANRDLHVTCRLMDSAEVARRAQAARAGGDQAVTDFDAACRLDPAAADWGYPWSEHQAAEWAVEAVPALVGWQGAGVRPLLDRLADVKKAWDKDATADVTRVHKSATAPGVSTIAPGSAVDVTLVQVGCGSSAVAMASSFGAPTDMVPDCLAELRMTARGAPVGLASFDGVGGAVVPRAGGVDVVLPNGRTEDMYVQAVVLGGTFQPTPPTQLQPGVDLTLLLGSSADIYTLGAPPPLQQGALLRIDGPAGPTFLRLR